MMIDGKVALWQATMIQQISIDDGEPFVYTYMIPDDELSDKDVAFLEQMNGSFSDDWSETQCTWYNDLCASQEEPSPNAPPAIPRGACITRVCMVTVADAACDTACDTL